MIVSILVTALFAIAAIFGTIGIIGLYRFPDAYSRLHAGSLASTTAVFTVLIAVVFIVPSFEFISRMLIIGLLFLISAPTGSHFVIHLIAGTGYENPGDDGDT